MLNHFKMMQSADAKLMLNDVKSINDAKVMIMRIN